MRPTLIYAAIFNASAVQGLLITIAALATIAAGVGVILTAKRADYGQTAKTSVNVMAGIALIALGAGAFGVVAFGQQILDALGVGK